VKRALVAITIGLVVVGAAAGAFFLGRDSVKMPQTASVNSQGGAPLTSGTTSTSFPSSAPMPGQYVNLADTSMTMVLTTEPGGKVVMSIVGEDEQYAGTASDGVMVLTQSCTACDAIPEPETATFGNGTITFAAGFGSPCATLTLGQGESCVFDYSPTQG
jgi:hypothetical protein